MARRRALPASRSTYECISPSVPQSFFQRLSQHADEKALVIPIYTLFTRRSTMIYTLISYTPGDEGWHDRCGDYHPGKDSSLEIRYFTNVQDAASAFAVSQFQNKDAEHRLLINGMSPDDWQGILSEEEGKALEDAFFAIDTIATTQKETLEAEKNKQLEALRIQKQQEEARKKLEQTLRLERAERAQLAELMSKYGRP